MLDSREIREGSIGKIGSIECKEMSMVEMANFEVSDDEESGRRMMKSPR